MKIEFFRHSFEKYSNIKFHENPPLGAELFLADRRRDRHDEVSRRFSQFCACAPIKDIDYWMNSNYI